MRAPHARGFVPPAIAVLALLVCARDSSARLVEVADCSGFVASDQAIRYVLATDIDCPTALDPVVSMARGSALDLRGFTLTAATVRCHGHCLVRGPGTINAGAVIGDDKVTVV